MKIKIINFLQIAALSAAFAVGAAGTGNAADFSISKRINNDFLSNESIPPDSWDYFNYATIDLASTLNLASIEEKLAQLNGKIPKDPKKAKAADLSARGELLLQKFIATYHSKLATFKVAFNKWHNSGSVGEKPIFSLGSDLQLLQKSLISLRLVIFNFPKKTHSDEHYLMLAQILALSNSDHALLYLKKLIKQYPKSPHKSEAQLLMADVYFNIKDYKTAVKGFSIFKNSNNNKLRLFALYKLAWLKRITHPESSQAFAENLKEVVRISQNQGEHKYGPTLKQEAMTDLAFLWSNSQSLDLAEEFFTQVQAPEFYLTSLEKVAQEQLAKKDFDGAQAAYFKILKSSPLNPANPFIFSHIIAIKDQQNMPVQVIKTILRMEKLYQGKSAWALANKESTPAAKNLLELTIRKFTIKYQSLASDTNSDIAKPLRALIEVYLRNFTDEKYSNVFRLKLAKLQADAKLYLKAAATYRILAEKSGNNATTHYALSKSALQQMDLALGARPPPTPTALHPLTEPMPLPKIVLLMLNYIDFHTKKFFTEDFDIAHLYSTAILYYTYGHYDKAQESWKKIIAEYSNSKFAQDSLRDIAAYYLLSQKYQDALTYLNKQFEDNMVKDPKTASVVINTYRGASFSLAKQAVVGGKIKEAAGFYLNLQKRLPLVKNADIALYEALLLTLKLGQIDQVLELGDTFLKSYDSSHLHADVLLQLADVQVGLLDLEEAIGILTQLVEKHPKHAMAANALYRAGNYALALDNRDQATTLYGELLSKYPEASIAGEVLIKVVNILIETDNFARARDLAEGFLKANAERKAGELLFAKVVVNLEREGAVEKLASLVMREPAAGREPTIKLLSQTLHDKLRTFVTDEADTEPDVGLDLAQVLAANKSRFKEAEVLFKSISLLQVPAFLLSANFLMATLYATHGNKLASLVSAVNPKQKAALQNYSFEAKENGVRYIESTQALLKKNLSNFNKGIYAKLSELKKAPPLPRELALEPSVSAIVLK